MSSSIGEQIRPTPGEDLYRFYEADREKLGGGGDLQEVDLERLKTKIQSKYEGR